ncbi:MAG: hypothetical protein R3D78_09475 [Paracoccaceae bacterium]
MIALARHLGIATFLTILTQLGGLAWLLALPFRRRGWAFAAFYLLLWLGAQGVAPFFGRVALPCWEVGPLQVASPLTCAMNRNYATPELIAVLEDAARSVAHSYPDSQTLVLDLNFPFLNGFPLVPHLSHDDGEKADLAYAYRDAGGYLVGRMRSPIGYFAFEEGPDDCPKTWPSLRWDLPWLQPLWPDHALEPERTRATLRALIEDPRVTKIFLEPHLQMRLSLSASKLRFQGCRAARHDDHVHLQL